MNKLISVILFLHSHEKWFLNEHMFNKIKKELKQFAKHCRLWSGACHSQFTKQASKQAKMQQNPPEL